VQEVLTHTFPHTINDVITSSLTIGAERTVLYLRPSLNWIYMCSVTRCDILKIKTALVKSVYRILERTFWSLVCFCELVQPCALLCKWIFVNVERTERGSVSNICWKVSHNNSWNYVILLLYRLLYLSAVFPWRTRRFSRRNSEGRQKIALCPTCQAHSHCHTRSWRLSEQTAK